MLLFNTSCIILLFTFSFRVYSTEYENNCSQIINEIDGPTLGLWSYLKDLLDQNVLSKTDLEKFYNELNNGKLINPVPHEMTSFGPVYKNAIALSSYKQVQKFIDFQNATPSYLNIDQLKEMTALELKIAIKNQNQKKSISTKANLDFYTDETLFNIWSNDIWLNHSEDNSFVRFENLMVKNFPKQMTKLAITLQEQRLSRKSILILQKLKALEQNFDLFLDDNKSTSALFSMIKVDDLSDPFLFVEKYFKYAKDASDQMHLLKLLENRLDQNAYSFLEKNESNFITYAEEIAFNMMLKTPGDKSLHLIKQLFVQEDANEKFLSKLAEALASKKGQEAYAFKLKILNQKFDSKLKFKHNLFHDFVGDNEEQLIEFFKLGINYKDDHVNYAAKDLIKKMSKVKAAQMAQYALGPFTRLSSKIELCHALKNNDSDEAIQFLTNFIKSNNQSMQLSAITSLATINSPKALEYVFEFIKQHINELKTISPVLYALTDQPLENILPLIRSWDKKMIPRSLIDLLNKNQNSEILKFLIETLNYEGDIVVVKNAVKAINLYPREVSYPILKDMALNHPDVDVRAYSLESFYSSEDPEAKEILLKTLNNTEPISKMNAIFAYTFNLLKNSGKNDNIETDFKMIEKSINFLKSRR